MMRGRQDKTANRTARSDGRVKHHEEATNIVAISTIIENRERPVDCPGPSEPDGVEIGRGRSAGKLLWHDAGDILERGGGELGVIVRRHRQADVEGTGHDHVQLLDECPIRR